MDWYRTVFELIDMRSFSNLWFWISVAVLWSSTSHWVLGVPYDSIQRAKRHGGTHLDDLETLARINVNRLLYIADTAGLWLVGLTAAFVSGLIVLGFVYRMEFAQALACLLVPMCLVGALTIRTARRIAAGENTGQALFRRLSRHRMTTQGIGMVAIFITSMWGMWQNLHIGVINH
ncbi:MAG: component of SufBCD complex [Rhodoferax sp.]|nr:component of SufBCD complex [Pseudorhodobacter sp.]